MSIAIHKYKYLFLFMYSLSALLLSVVIKQDGIFLLNLAVFGAFISFFLLKQEVLLLLITVFISIFYEAISPIVNGTYVVFYFYGLMVLSLLLNKKELKSNNTIVVLILLSFLLSLLPLIVNGTSIPIIVIAALKRFGFIIPFIFALNISSISSSYEKYINLLIITVLIGNFIYAVFQYSQGIFHQDDITGLLGENMTGIFMYLFMFYLAIISGKHYQKKIPNWLFMILVFIPVIYSALAEVKIGFVSIAILLFVYLVFINRSGKSYLLLASWILIFAWAYALFVSIYPEHDFLSEAFLEDYLVNQSYGNGSTINRLGFKETIDTLIFSDGSTEILFGKGLGSGNPSDLDLLMGEVFRDFEYLQYSWFAIPYLYIEVGWIGTVFYLLIYFVPLIFSITEFKKKKSGISVVLILMGITNFIYLPYNAGIFTYGVTTIYWLFVAILLKKNTH